MKYFILLALSFNLSQGLAQNPASCSLSIFKGVGDILLELTTLEDVTDICPNCVIEKRRHNRTGITPKFVEKIVFFDSLGLEIHLQKQKHSKNYLVYHIRLKESCPCMTINGLGIGSTYNDVSKIHPTILTEHTNRLMRSVHKGKKRTFFKMGQNSVHVTFYSKGWIESQSFVINEIQLHTSNLIF
ncbi:MAG: hypothetical protein HUJ25_12930 [Crocinitomicaceae bacterium]|nr:hypothetical protein [Crocinitomicaceae bacterium]